jgi:hypothetical protein
MTSALRCVLNLFILDRLLRGYDNPPRCLGRKFPADHSDKCGEARPEDLLYVVESCRLRDSGMAVSKTTPDPDDSRGNRDEDQKDENPPEPTGSEFVSGGSYHLARLIDCY